MTKFFTMTRNKLRVLIAVLVAIAVVVPSALFISLRGKAANEQTSRVTVDGLETVKTVTPVEGEDGKYHVKLEAYNTSEFLNQPANDIILVLDDSSRMDTELYRRYYKNLNTHTIIGTEVPLSSINYHALYDPSSPDNVGAIPGVGELTSAYKNRKYVEDPNTPGIYVYVSGSYLGISDWSQHYRYDFTDSMGNKYSTGDIPHNFIDTVGSLTFTLQERGPDVPADAPVKDTVVITSMWTRDSDDTAALNSTIVQQAGEASVEVTEWETYYYEGGFMGYGAGEKSWDDSSISNEAEKQSNWMSRKEVATYEGKLFIYSDDGRKLPVTVEVEREATRSHSILGFGSPTYTNYKYTYRVIDGDKEYIAVQGNDVYGADYGVFQGFKTYQWKKDSDGNYVYKLDNQGNPTTEHELEVVHSQSLESKSLYAYTDTEQVVTRLDAMKEAVENFAIKVHQDAYYKGTDVRLGIVTYGKNGEVYQPLMSVYDEIGVNKLIDKMYHMETENTALGILDSNAAQIDEGMAAAYNHFATNSPEENKRFAVAFTAGMPTKNYWGYNTNENKYSTDVATGAVQYAYKMKNEQAVNIYSVGMYENAKASQTHGDWFYYTLYPKYACNGNVGSIWGATTGATINPFREVDVTDAAAINRMMNYISSDYGDANSIGINRRTLGLNPAGYALTTAVLSGKGYQVTKNYNQTDEGHYFAVSTCDDSGNPVDGDQINADLQAVFDELAENVEVAQGYLTGSAQLKDTITDYFDLVPDTVTYKTMNYQGPNLDDDDCWTDDAVPVTPGTEYPNEAGFEPETVNLTVEPSNLTADTKEITLTGFPYSENYVVEDKHVTNKAGNYGKKVVLEFDIVRTDGLIGGNYVPTNASSSGVFDEDTHLEENFEIPHVDLPLIADNVNTKDQSIYYSYEADLSTLLDPEVVNGFNNSFVDITYTITDPDDPTNPITYTVLAGETAPTEQATMARYPQLTESKTYSVTVTINPEVREGTIPRDTLDPMDANVYVFVPALDVYDETVDPGDEVDLTPTEHNPAWICDLNTDNNDQNDVTAPAPTMEAPELTYQIINKTDNNAVVPEADWTHYQIDETQDFQVVNVTIPARTFIYYYAEEVQATDDDGNPLVDDDNNPVMVTEIQTVETNRTAVVIPQADVYFTNTTAPSKTEGNYTKYTGNEYDLYVQKLFSGDYVIPEGVRFVITGADGSTQNVEIAENEFTHLSSEEKKATNTLRTGITYTLEEQFLQTTDIIYDTTATQKTGTNSQSAAPLTDTDASDGKAIFQFTVASAEDPGSVTIVVTNTDTSEPPVVTGVSEKESMPPTALLIALAASVTVASGGYGIYRVYKPKKED